MNNTVMVGDFVKFKNGSDEWEVDDITHQHYQISFGNTSISVKKGDVALSRKLLTHEDKYEKMREALHMIYLGDWSAISGMDRPCDFAEEVLKEVGEFER